MESSAMYIGYGNGNGNGNGNGYGYGYAARADDCVFASATEAGNPLAEPQIGSQPTILSDAAMINLPADVWHLITSHLMTAEKMALRSTATAVYRNLKVLTDAILYACGTIDDLTGRGNQAKISAPAFLDELSTFPLDVRCDMIRRYAKQAGAYAGIVFRHIPIATNWEENGEDFRMRFTTKPSAEPGSDRECLTSSWRRTVDVSKAALLEMTSDASASIALSDLYAAEMYAPLLGVVPSPEAHIMQVMVEAAERLSVMRWMDFLYSVGSLVRVCKPLSDAYETLAANFDANHPMPRIDVLAAIIQSMVNVRTSQSVRERCISRMHVTVQMLQEEVVPRVTLAIAEQRVSKSPIAPFIWNHILEGSARRWKIDDASYLMALHNAFLTTLAKMSYSESTRWSSLPEAVHVAMRTRILGIPPSDLDAYLPEGTATLLLWKAYFAISNNMLKDFGISESELDTLPWPLLAALLRHEAEILARPRDVLQGRFCSPHLDLSSLERVDRICTQALRAGQPEFALMAVQAALKWQITRACERTRDARTLPLAPELKQLEFTAAMEWVIAACTGAQRLPLIADLFSYREVLMKCNYAWTFDDMISDNVRAFLIDERSSLIRPSKSTRNVLWHHVHSCIEALPEWTLGPNHWEAAFAKRFDLLWTGDTVVFD